MILSALMVGAICSPSIHWLKIKRYVIPSRKTKRVEQSLLLFVSVRSQLSFDLHCFSPTTSRWSSSSIRCEIADALNRIERDVISQHFWDCAVQQQREVRNVAFVQFPGERDRSLSLSGREREKVRKNNAEVKCCWSIPLTMAFEEIDSCCFWATVLMESEISSVSNVYLANTRRRRVESSSLRKGNRRHVHRSLSAVSVSFDRSSLKNTFRLERVRRIFHTANEWMKKVSRDRQRRTSSMAGSED